MTRVVVDADAHPASVALKFICAVRDSLALFGNEELMDPYRFRVSLRSPLLAGILEVSHEFLLLVVDRNGRMFFLLELSNLLMDVTELSVSIWDGWRPQASCDLLAGGSRGGAGSPLPHGD